MGRNEIRTSLKRPARGVSLRSSGRRGKNNHPPVLPALHRWGRFSARNFQRRRARRNGCFRRLWRKSKIWVLLTDWVKTEKVTFQAEAESCGTGITYSVYIWRQLRVWIFVYFRPKSSMNANLPQVLLMSAWWEVKHAAPRVSCQVHIENKIITNWASIQESYITMF